MTELRATILTTMAFQLHRRSAPQRRMAMLAFGFMVAVAVSGCSDAGNDESLTPRRASEEMIAGPISDKAGVGSLAGICPDLADAAIGSTFECSATTDDQQNVIVDGLVTPDGRIELTTRNVIRSEVLPSFEQAAVTALNDSLGSNLSNEAIDCGNDSIVLGPDQQLVCALLDPQTSSMFDVSLTITDVESRQFSLVVADEPR